MLKKYIERIKKFMEEKPLIATLIGGGALFLLWFLFFHRRQVAGAGALAAPLQVIPPGDRFIPPEDIGSEPQWGEDWQATQRNILGELENIGMRMEGEGRNVAFIREVIRDVEENVAPTTAPTPVVALRDAPVLPHIPNMPLAPGGVRDRRLIADLSYDIARVERARRDPQAVAYFQRVRGGIDTYLASQRERLRRAMAGV